MTAVVYALRHGPKGLVYVGSSLRWEKRAADWRRKLALLEVGGRPRQMTDLFYRAAVDLAAADWEFVVVEKCAEDVTRAFLAEREYFCLMCFYRLDRERCLNVKDGIGLRIRRDFETYGRYRAEREFTRFL